VHGGKVYRPRKNVEDGTGVGGSRGGKGGRGVVIRG
jgi:hypothetical protein